MSAIPHRQAYLGGRFEDAPARDEVRAPWDGRVVATVARCDAAMVERALAAAVAARPAGRALSTGRRRALCQALSDGIARRAEELASAICDEAGKPVVLARTEVRRARTTFALAAAELVSARPEAPPLDLDDASAGFDAVVRHVPAGVVVAISPFNFPLNLGAHKVAPALAVGAPVIWKPPPQAPSAAAILAELAGEAGVPPGLLQVVPCGNAEAEALATDPRVAVLSFTGSGAVGQRLRRLATNAKVVLELGGNAAAIVCADGDVDRAAARCALSAYAYAGQVCISAQRLLVERSVVDRFRARFLEEAAKLPVGDPRDERTVVGPVIDARHLARIEAWIEEARAAGAVVHGGGRQGTALRPALLEGARPDLPVVAEEVFGPVAVLEPFDRFEDALAAVNASRFGLQAALFTRDLEKARAAFRELEVGGVIVNEHPSFRQDSMPYGGVKGSGLGREGLRYAMADYTEPRILVLARKE